MRPQRGWNPQVENHCPRTKTLTLRCSTLTTAPRVLWRPSPWQLQQSLLMSWTMRVPTSQNAPLLPVEGQSSKWLTSDSPGRQQLIHIDTDWKGPATPPPRSCAPPTATREKSRHTCVGLRPWTLNKGADWGVPYPTKEEGKGGMRALDSYFGR